MNPWGFLILAVGLFAAAGGAFDWDWYMNHPKARFVSVILTRTGARVFYVVFGLGLVVVGVLMTMGVIRDW